jgi:hypothetical protein
LPYYFGIMRYEIKANMITSRMNQKTEVTAR